MDIRNMIPDRPRVGLDIGSRHVRVAQLRTVAGGWAVERCVSFRRRRPGLLPDEGEAARIARTMQRHGIATQHVIAAVPNACLQTSLMEIPRGEAGDPAAFVFGEFTRMHGTGGAEFELAAWNVSAERRGAATELLAVGCDTTVSAKFLDTLEAAGIDVCRLDARSLAAHRCLGLAERPHGVEAILDLDDDQATLCLAAGGRVTYQRAMSCGGLDRVREQFREQCDKVEVEEYLWTRRPADWKEVNDTGPVRALRALVAAHAASAAEDLRAAAGYVGQHFGGEIDRVWAIGPGAGLPGYERVLKDRGFNVAPPSAARLLVQHVGSAVAIGLAAPTVDPEAKPDPAAEPEAEAVTTPEAA